MRDTFRRPMALVLSATLAFSAVPAAAIAEELNPVDETREALATAIVSEGEAAKEAGLVTPIAGDEGAAILNEVAAGVALDVTAGVVDKANEKIAADAANADAAADAAYDAAYNTYEAADAAAADADAADAALKDAQDATTKDEAAAAATTANAAADAAFDETTVAYNNALAASEAAAAAKEAYECAQADYEAAKAVADKLLAAGDQAAMDAELKAEEALAKAEKLKGFADAKADEAAHALALARETAYATEEAHSAAVEALDEAIKTNVPVIAERSEAAVETEKALVATKAAVNASELLVKGYETDVETLTEITAALGAQIEGAQAAIDRAEAVLKALDPEDGEAAQQKAAAEADLAKAQAALDVAKMERDNAKEVIAARNAGLADKAFTASLANIKSGDATNADVQNFTEYVAAQSVALKANIDGVYWVDTDANVFKTSEDSTTLIQAVYDAETGTVTFIEVVDVTNPSFSPKSAKYVYETYGENTPFVATTVLSGDKYDVKAVKKDGFMFLPDSYFFAVVDEDGCISPIFKDKCGNFYFIKDGYCVYFDVLGYFAADPEDEGFDATLAVQEAWDEADLVEANYKEASKKCAAATAAAEAAEAAYQEAVEEYNHAYCPLTQKICEARCEIAKLTPYAEGFEEQLANTQAKLAEAEAELAQLQANVEVLTAARDAAIADVKEAVSELKVAAEAAIVTGVEAAKAKASVVVAQAAYQIAICFQNEANDIYEAAVKAAEDAAAARELYQQLRLEYGPDAAIVEAAKQAWEYAEYCAKVAWENYDSAYAAFMDAQAAADEADEIVANWKDAKPAKKDEKKAAQKLAATGDPVSIAAIAALALSGAGVAFAGSKKRR